MIYRISVTLTLLFAFVCGLFAQATLKPQELATTIANRIISETPYTFTDKVTKETFTSLKGVKMSRDMKVSNEYNEWHYTNGVLHMAMLELADRTGDKKYEDYVSKNMEFVFDKDNYAYFEKQYNEAFKEGGWKAIRKLTWHMIHRNKRLDDNGPMGAGLIELQMRRPNKAYLNYINSTEEHLMLDEPRLYDGTIARIWPHENTIWADDLFMAISFLCRMGKMTGDVKYFDDAANQVLNYHKYLWHPGKEIYYHCYHTDVKEHGVAHWSRANGWMIMAQADLLTMLPENHPKKAALIENYNRQIKGILHYQGKNGLWHQVLDKPDSYEEITGTAMFVFGIARGVRMGWINKDYIYAAEQGLKGMMTKMTDDGDVTAICVGTGIMPSLSFYYNRPVQKNAPMGEGPVLRTLIEMSLANRYSEISADSQYDKIGRKR
ncbi:glycosyl hydrolase family 88 [Bacteroides sp. 214]|uniref:glycoside hydrolase family 88/105 protein n=1 Tax=Bacteroides sp. 214 TaxID=2302935 RepID=UPI0013D1C4D5|nr:glycoside hydrolase family 88 protein [Bacteroides sp. 214]NDW12978.1 glycosyl hydrolase family 88 [Bacteroides sp. 214]